MKLRFALVMLAALSLAVSGCGKKDAAGGAKTAKTKKSKKDKKKKKKKSSYEEIDVKDGGTISGTITYAGDKKDGAANVNKDQEVCKPQPQEGAIIVADGKLKNAVVLLDGVKKGKKWAENPLVVDNLECSFTPRISFGKLKGTLLATNSDTVLHNTHAFLTKGNKDLFNVALASKGKKAEKKLKKPGLIDLKCDAHEWMQAYVWVTAHPYVAITGADGSFSMTNVPAGEYTAKIWHEKLGEKEAKVTVTAGGTAKLDQAM